MSTSQTKRKVWTVAMATLAALLVAGCQREQAAPVVVAVEDAVEAPAPAAAPPPAPGRAGLVDKPVLQVTTVDGQAYDLAEHRGQWVLVNFWATWCAPCLKEMPELSALDALREHIEVIGLAYEEIDTVDMQAFLRDHPVLYPVAIVDVNNPPPDFDTPRGLPMTYLINPAGRVARTYLGPVTALDIEEAIAAAGGPELAGAAEAGGAAEIGAAPARQPR